MKRKVIALTGSIGSGKSEVARILRSFGYQTVNCDDLAKIIADTPEVVCQVEQLLGSKYISNGRLNRRAIRDKVFADEALLAQYQAIFFDGVRQLLTDTLADLNDEVVFVEIPVLNAFEFGWDEVWLVQCDPNTQIARVTARDGVSAKNVSDTLARQHKYTNCTRVIANNGSFDELTVAVRHALDSIGLK